MLDLSCYDTLVFDCDGVILDSNPIKTEAFRIAALPYGPEAANCLVAYHLAHGGLSRYEKFEYFLREVVQGRAGPTKDELAGSFAAIVQDGLRNCPVAPRLEVLRQHTNQTRWFMVSGGDQRELRQVLQQRRLAALFDGGIYGSPASKEEIFSRLLKSGVLGARTLYFGDSRLDHVSASALGLDFVFVSKWSEFADWDDYCTVNGLPSISALEDLLPQAHQAS